MSLKLLMTKNEDLEILFKDKNHVDDKIEWWGLDEGFLSYHSIFVYYLPENYSLVPELQYLMYIFQEDIC